MLAAASTAALGSRLTVRPSARPRTARLAVRAAADAAAAEPPKESSPPPKEAPKAEKKEAKGNKAADRNLWFPGNVAVVPDYLDGSLVGDFGFDPLGLGSSPEQLAWNVHAEVFHCRLAMTAVAGILLTSLLHSGGANVPEWYEAGRVYLDRNPNVSFGALLFTTIVLSGFAEFKRLADIRNPGSQGSGILPADFKGQGGPLGRKEGGPYVGGRFFDPMGLCRGSEAQTLKYQWNEIRNGRLAMIAFLGFAAQYAATGKGPIDNLIDHVSNPTAVNFTTNGVSVPFIS